MMKNTLKFFLFICLLTVQVYAQKEDIQTGDPNDLDQKFLPDKNSLLNSANNSKTSSDGYGKQLEVKNIFKFNLALLGRSTVAFAWEHPFGNLVSVEGGLGICVGQDYMQKTFAEVGDAFAPDNSSNNNNIKLSDLLASSKYSGSPTPFLTAGVKLYFADEAPEGWYVHLSMRYSTNNLTLTPNNDKDIGIMGNPNLTVKNLSFNLLYGYQIVTGTHKASFVQDVFLGFGFRHTTYSSFDLEIINNPNSGYTQNFYSSNGNRQTMLMPVFVIGYCLGFGL